MPSDDRIRAALDALAPARNAFRSAVATADEEVRAYHLKREVMADPVSTLAAELGPFAAGRIDPGRLAGLLEVEDAPDPLTDRLMEVAHEMFGEVTALDAEAFHAEVAPGADLRDVVRDALAGLGRAFGVSHAIEKSRTHRYDPDRDYTLLHPYPFHRWAPAERRLAPPLVVSLRGEDLRAASLAEFMDGTLKLVLVVDGPVPPAPLARLISSEVFVAQTSSAEVVAKAVEYDGAAVVAWTGEKAGAVSFVHDPDAGARSWARLHLAEDGDALAVRLAEIDRRGGRASGAAADLRHLIELATPLDGAGAAERVEPGAAESASGDDAADRLAAWLLARTDLGGL